MSRTAIDVTPDEVASNEEFRQRLLREKLERRIKRHSLQARITHGTVAICCIWLVISGLFVFIPPLASAAGGEAVYAMRMSHRIIGIIFVVVPILSAIIAPLGAAHMFKEMLHKWDSDDKKWMALFMPYLFLAKRMHMPDQHETKSGQRFADGMLVALGILMGVTGLLLIFETSFLNWGSTAHSVILFLHDLGFFGFCVFGMAHIFLGAGIFQPYRGTVRLMFGDGTVSESDALYHWGHWARKEIEDGTNIEYRRD